MYIIDMNGSSSSQLTVCLTPRSSRLVGGKALTRIFRHGIDIGIQRQRLLEHQWSVGVVRTQHDRRNIRTTAGLQTILDARDNRLLHPCHVILDGGHCFTETDEQTDIGIILNEGGDALAGVVADERCDRTMTVLCLQTVMVSKRLAQDDIIEHLDNPDATTVCLMGKEREYFLILLECLFVHLQGKGIVLQLHQ